MISCNSMKKSVMNDLADDVKEAIISGTGGEYFVVTKEEIYQATSKSDNGGIRQITGYVEYRISSYDLNTGKLSARIDLGDRNENECTFLGETKGKLWYKSVDKNLGFHAREPKNLSVIISQEKLTEVNPFLKNNISLPEWNNILTYYGFDTDKNMPMVTDNSGFVYYINPETLAAEKTSESIVRNDHNNNCLSTSMNIDAENLIYLQGSPRNYLSIYTKENKDISFLKGEFLLRSYISESDEENQKFFAPYMDEIAGYKREIDSIREILSSTDSNSGDKNSKYYYRDNKKYAERNIQNLLNKIKYAEDNIKRNSRNDNYSLITKDNGVFIISQTDVTDQAKVLISKVRIDPDSTSKQIWQTELQDIYRNPDKGMDKSSFEIVFSKGNPNLNTMRVISGNGRLVLIFMLRAVCLDTETGIVIWNIELK
jgi:hypothetical protein